MINSNVRSVKWVRSEAAFTALPSSMQGKEETLCKCCSKMPECAHLKKLKAMSKRGIINVNVTQCREYRFPMTFLDQKGTDGSFNTIRLGKAWAERLSPEMEVGLLNRKGEVYGIAEVISAEVGDKQAMLNHHAKNNHLVLTEKSGQVEKIDSVLKRTVGAMVYDQCAHLSVIYLKRVS